MNIGGIDAKLLAYKSENHFRSSLQEGKTPRSPEKPTLAEQQAISTDSNPMVFASVGFSGDLGFQASSFSTPVINRYRLPI